MLFARIRDLSVHQEMSDNFREREENVLEGATGTTSYASIEADQLNTITRFAFVYQIVIKDDVRATR